jgi:hypothetical protein
MLGEGDDRKREEEECQEWRKIMSRERCVYGAQPDAASLVRTRAMLRKRKI